MPLPVGSISPSAAFAAIAASTARAAALEHVERDLRRERLAGRRHPVRGDDFRARRNRDPLGRGPANDPSIDHDA